MWWSIARAVLRCPPVFYCLYSIVLVTKWAVWFPIMVVRYGLNDALDAALTTPDAGRLNHGRNLADEPSSPEQHRRNGTDRHRGTLKFRQLAAHFLHWFVG
jgi:hypothetical protein